jgi:hypothetical protein
MISRENKLCVTEVWMLTASVTDDIVLLVAVQL